MGQDGRSPSSISRVTPRDAFTIRAADGTLHAAAARMKITLSIFALCFGVLACGGSKEPAEGPAERAGEDVDEAGDKVEQKAEEAGDKVEEAGDKAEDKIDKETKEE
jgi:hypothetical protein